MDPKDTGPAGLAAYRLQREERKRERRRQQKARDSSMDAPDYGREIAPRLNPDVPDMVDQVKKCLDDLTTWIAGFGQDTSELVGAGKLDPAEGHGLLQHYDNLQKAVDDATAHALRWHTHRSGPDADALAYTLADHAKYVYAVGARDIAAMQYRLAELAHTSRLDYESHKLLQRRHCYSMWETLYRGTTAAVRDKRTWDGGWDWADNTYSDGRQVMTDVRVNNWQELNRDWPYKASICGDGPILEHPRGSVCQIAPVADPTKDRAYQYDSLFEIEIDDLLRQLGPAPLDDDTLDDMSIASAQNSLLLEPPGIRPPWVDVPTGHP